MRITKLALLAGATVLALLSQTPPPASVPAADPVIRVSVNLVQVNAVVTDSKGRHISGLGPDDFDLFEDGKPQKITHLSYLDATPATATQATGPAPVKGSKPVEIVSAPARKPRREDVRRAMVLLVDDIHTSREDLVQLKPVAKKFVTEQIAPGDLVSISTVRGGMGFYEQFTSDRNVLNGAVESLMKRVGGSSDPVDPDEGAMGCLRTRMLFEAVMGKLSWSIQSLSELPGRKSIVLFSDGLTLERQACPDDAQAMAASMERVADESNRAGVSIYAIDSRGLTTNQFTASENPMAGRGGARGGAGLAAALRAKSDHSAALQETPSFLADETGGIFFKNTNGLSEALGQSMEDMSGYYLIGFQPQRTDFELRNGTAVFHKVSVKLRRKGLSIRFGKGFLGTPDKDTSEPLTPAQQLTNALVSPFDSGSIRVRLTPLYVAPSPGPNGERRPTVIRALLSIDGSDLHLTEAANGEKKANLNVVAAAYSFDNTRIAMHANEFTLSGKPDDLSKLSKGVTYQTAIELPRSGAYQIRAAVRDGVTGNLGSANALVIVPDFNRAHISLSSLILSGTDSRDALSQAATREFPPEVPITYNCEVYGSKGPVAIEVRLFHDGAQVFASSPMTVNPPSSPRVIPVTGKLKLPSSLAEGDYQVELIARDPLAPAKQQTTSQWSDLILVKPAQ